MNIKRLARALRTDIIVQFRNKLYHVGAIISLMVAVAMAALVGPTQMQNTVPAAILLIIGGTTMLYIAGMVIFEKDEGTIAATIVAPLTTGEYITSKVASLVLLATLESLLSIYGASVIHAFQGEVVWPNPFWLILGILSVGTLFTLVGLAIVVRFQRITDFLIPMAGVAVIMQIPFVYFWGFFKHPILLLSPTSAPTMLMEAGYRPLVTWEQIYSLGYTCVAIIVFALLAKRAFRIHIIEKMG